MRTEWSCFVLDLTRLTISEALEKIKNKEISIIELVRSYLKQIENLNKTIGAYITVCREDCERMGPILQEKLDCGENIPLAGIPMALSDNIITRGVLTTCASKMLHNFIPQYDSTVNEKLRHSGAILLGKLNMDEFSIGSSNENSYFGPVKNPWDPEGFQAVHAVGLRQRVAANMACLPWFGCLWLWTAFILLWGCRFKTNLWSDFKIWAYCICIVIGANRSNNRTVEDCAIVLNAIAGYDPKDSTSANIKHPDYTAFLKDNIKGLKIGLPKEYIEKGLQKEIKQNLCEALTVFESMGAVVEEISIPMTKYAIPAYYIIASAEASSNLARYDGIRYGYRAEDCESLEELYKKTRSEGFGFEVKRTIMLGAYFISRNCYDSYYKKALKVRRLISEDFKKAFNDIDVIITPTVPKTAFKTGRKDDPIQMCMSNIYTVSANLAGLCAISIPHGTDCNGLPVGLQLIGKPFDEGTLIRAAYAFEKNT